MANAKPCFVVERVEWEDNLIMCDNSWEDRCTIGVFTDKEAAKEFIENEASGTDYPCKWKVGQLVYSGVLDYGGYREGIRYEILRSLLFD